MGECSNIISREWLTHPAFTSFDVNGMWVGKFETGYRVASTTEEAEVNVNEPNKIQIKPNVYSWRSINVANAYLSSYEYKREYNSHMMKNTEWGAVAYLQHSKYGSGNVSVRINNNESFLTGYGATKEPTCGYTATNEECNRYGTTTDITQPWNTEYGRLASTTGNMYGVYDMSGGAWEYVMGVMLDSTNTQPCSGRKATYNSGFNGPYCNTTGSLTTGVNFPEDSRYYDVYAYGTNDEGYNRRILGDATGEMGPFATKTYGTQNRQVGSWHEDEAWFVTPVSPWFHRGYRFAAGSDTGMFAFDHYYGSAYVGGSFRVVLAF